MFKWIAKTNKDEVLQDIPENNPNKRPDVVRDNTFTYDQATYKGEPLKLYNHSGSGIIDLGPSPIIACSGLLREPILELGRKNIYTNSLGQYDG